MRELVEQVYGRMPREFATPQRREVESVDRLVEGIDAHNGLSDVYVSAFAFADDDPDERSYGNITIDRAVFDFDDEWEELVRFHGWLDERDVAHFVVFSGSDRSGHVYVLTEPTTHQQSLEYFQRDVLVEGAGLRRHRCGHRVERHGGRITEWYCEACGRPAPVEETSLLVDENLIGDAATMIRVPNTWHPDAGRFCVPLRPGEITTDVREVYRLAEGQRDLSLGDVVSGSKTPDITQRRAEAERKYQAHAGDRRMADIGADADADFAAEVDPPDMFDDIECSCVRRLVTDESGNMTNPDLGHRARRVLISALVERGYNPAEIDDFLRWAISDEKARHSIVDEEQSVRVWRDGVKAPNKMSLKRAGMWRAGCPVHGSDGATAVGAAGGDG